MSKSVPIKKIQGIELLPTERPTVFAVRVTDAETRKNLSWDRYVRLKASADAIRNLAAGGASILDVGGYDGALGLFLPDYKLHLIDPETTGGSLLHEPIADQAYEIVAAIDVLEHIAPPERAATLKELSRVARRFIVLNYPCRQTSAAQELMFKATNNPLVQEHVQWELPDTEWVLENMQDLGFTGSANEHSSLAVWLGQYLALNLVPEVAINLNRYLIEHHADEPFSTPLYHLIVCEKKNPTPLGRRRSKSPLIEPSGGLW